VKGAALQWVQVPPGNRSSPKQPESHGGDKMAEAFGVAVHGIGDGASVRAAT
jgi:hypothetical protein